MIEVNNLTTKEIDEEFLRNMAETVLRGEKTEENADLSIVLVGSRRIRKLNKDYRGKNKVTDVLSFSTSKKDEKNLFFNVNNLGEIIICLREIKKTAKRTGSNFKKELARCLIHGILHLLGYEHEKSKEGAKKMEKKQKKYLLEAESRNT